jgi:hypothetical protein
MDAGQEMMVTVNVTALDPYDLDPTDPWVGEKYSVELERGDVSVANKLTEAIERKSDTPTWCQELFKHGLEVWAHISSRPQLFLQRH